MVALKGISAYKKGNLKQDIANADPHKLTLMLFQGALDRIAYAKGAMARKEYAQKSEHISRANSILIHLRDTLDLDIGGELSENLFSLYNYMIERLTDAHTQNDQMQLDEVSSLLGPIRDAWLEIPAEAKEEAYRLQNEKKQAL
ncbi:Flagellar secretion chaperone FliSB [Alteromonas macleodii]